MPDYLGDIGDLLSGYVESGGLRVSVKTNYGPEIPVYSGKSSGGSSPVAALIGFKAQVIVRDAKGKVVQTMGDPVPTDWVRVLTASLLLSAIAIVVVRGVIK